MRNAIQNDSSSTVQLCRNAAWVYVPGNLPAFGWADNHGPFR